MISNIRSTGPKASSFSTHLRAGSGDDNSSIGQFDALRLAGGVSGRPESADYFTMAHHASGAADVAARSRLQRPDTAPPLVGGAADDDDN